MKNKKKYRINLKKQNLKRSKQIINNDSYLQSMKYFEDHTQTILSKLPIESEESSESIVLNTEGEIKEYLDKIKNEIIAISKGINQNQYIPILMYCIDKIYYEKEFHNYREFGISIKNLIAILWINGMRNTTFVSSNFNFSVITLLNKMIVYDTLRQYYWLYLVGDTNLKLHITVTENQVILDKSSLIYIESNYIIPDNTYGQYQRSVLVNNKKLVENIFEYVKSVNRIVKGENPSEINYFKDTFFKYFKGIDDVNYTKFWLGLKLRLDYFCKTVKNEKDNHGLSVVKMIDFYGSISDRLEKDFLIESSIWSKDFIDSDYLENYNKIVSRPFIPLYHEKLLFTSSNIIIDSLNFFIESFIFNSDGTKKLPDYDSIVFEKAFSFPFEHSTIELFKSYNFYSGKVTNKGTWQVNSDEDIKNSDLNNKLFQSKNIGEIDCLARSDHKKIIYIIECKVLQLPATFKKYKNRVTHINNEHRQQLEKKTEFIKNLFSDYTIKPVLLLDKGFTMKRFEKNQNNVRLMTFEMLKEELEKYDKDL